MGASNDDGFNRDSGIVRSSPATDLSLDLGVDDDDEPSGTESAQTSDEPRSLPTETCQSTEIYSRLSSAADSLNVTDTQSSRTKDEDLQTLARPDLDTSPVKESGEGSSPVATCERTTLTKLPSTPSVLAPGTVGNEELTARTTSSNCDMTDSKVSASVCEDPSLPDMNMNLSRTSFKLTPTFSTFLKSFSTPGKQETSASPTVVSASTPSTTAKAPHHRQLSSTPHNQRTAFTSSPPTTVKAPHHRELSSTPHKERTAPRTSSSTPGNQDRPRSRVRNIEFLTATNTSQRPRKPPMFIRKMRNVSVTEGDTARFEVTVGGNPVPSVTWLKNGVELAIDGHKHSVEAVTKEGQWCLVVSNCTKDDECEYGCTATSDIGKITSRCRLYVEPRTDPSERHPHEGQT